MGQIQTAIPDGDQLFLDYLERFGDEEKSTRTFERFVYPDGFRCRRCRRKEGTRLATRPGVVVCRHCRLHHTLTAGTALHHTHAPVYAWFSVIFLSGIGWDVEAIAKTLRLNPRTITRWLQRLNQSVSGRALVSRFWAELRTPSPVASRLAPYAFVTNTQRLF